MFVPLSFRGTGIASAVLANWKNGLKNQDITNAFWKPANSNPRRLHSIKKMDTLIFQISGSRRSENSLCFEKKII